MSAIVLTSEQQAVVDADLFGPRLVDAGAGTGKTFTLVRRALGLIRRGTVSAGELLVVTFTKAAATEIDGRLVLELELDADLHQRPTCGTFHGIAGDLLREFAYEAGISPDVRAIDDGRARGVFARAFADLVAGRLEVDVSAFPLLDRPKALERSLATMVLGLKQRGTNVAAFMQRAHDAAAELEAIDFGSVQMLKQRRGQSAAKAVAKSGWPRPDPPRSAAERRLEAARERSNIKVVAALFAHFQRLLDAENLLTFGDILTRATQMLRDRPSIADALRARWKHAIVDEFQDTNDTQIGFLEALFGADLRPVLVVGDVRQAIYEFNGAQPQGIVDFRERAREKLPLTVNRRSLQPILDVAHATLEELGGVEPSLNARLVAHRGLANPQCVRVELFEGSDALEREAARIAGAIRALVDDGLSPQQCAVLIRTRTRAGVFAQAIRDRGLAVQLYGGVGFFDAPEVREVVAWLRLADDPTDAFAVVAALQSAAIGLSDGGVSLLASGGDLPRAALLEALPAALSPEEGERLERFRRTARVVCALTDVPLVDAARSIVFASGAEIARLSAGPALGQVRANLEKLVRFAADFAGDRPLARIRDLVNELRERDELELDLPIAEVEGDRVAIMTIHGAKGLEWDHVFLADVGAMSFPLTNNDSRDKVAQFDQSSGALALKHAIDGRPTLRWYLTLHQHDDCGTVGQDEAPKSAEEFRLLYVALTRARDAVYVTGRRSKTNAVSRCLRAVQAWASEVSGSAERHRFPPLHDGVDVRPSIVAEVDTELDFQLSARVLRSLEASVAHVERRGTLSYTAMDLHQRCPRRARYHYVLGLPDLSDESPIADANIDEDVRESRDPARFGRVIHRALELLVQARMTQAEVGRDSALAKAPANDARAETPANGARTKAPANDAPAETRANDARTKAPANDARAETRANDARTKAPANDARTETPANGARTKAPANDAHTETLANGARAETRANDVRAETRANDARPETPANGARTETRANDERTETPAAGARTETRANDERTETPANGARAETRANEALREALAKEDWAPRAVEHECASKAISDAMACLETVELTEAERRFEIDIDGVRLGGSIDLIARDHDGVPLIVDYKTGRTAAQHYALQFALYAHAVKNEFPVSKATLLRIRPEGAWFEPVVPATEAELRHAIVSARTMESDEPRPGLQCSYCPYAHDVCSAALD